MTKTKIDELMALVDLCIQASHFKEVGKTYSHYVDSRRKLRTALDAALKPVEPDASIEQIATDRYKVVHSHESMFHRFAVVAGNGKQQLYIGREVECENVARKFAGAFLDGAFVQAGMAAPKDSLS
jgi:hypothetical protein